MTETELQQRKGQWYQGYSLSTTDIEKRFQAKYGYLPDKIIITGGGILVGPIVGEKHDSIGNH